MAKQLGLLAHSSPQEYTICDNHYKGLPKCPKMLGSRDTEPNWPQTRTVRALKMEERENIDLVQPRAVNGSGLGRNSNIQTRTRS